MSVCAQAKDARRKAKIDPRYCHRSKRAGRNYVWKEKVGWVRSK